MPESTIYPQDIELDIIKGGVARLLCHWNIESVLREDSLVYQYEEAVIKWALPGTFETKEDVEAYITANADEIMGFAKATKLTM